MRRPLLPLVPLAALGLGLSACSLLVDFDEEGQPCDDRNQCLAGYVCQNDACVASEGASDGGGSDGGADAGTDAGSDAGTDGDVDGGP